MPGVTKTGGETEKIKSDPQELNLVMFISSVHGSPSCYLMVSGKACGVIEAERARGPLR